jgi:3D (Asp-Asp-Asp) domain-containing protein
VRATIRSALLGLGLSTCLLVSGSALAATVSGPIGSTTLSRGDRGFPVRVLQGDLAQLGEYTGAVTGYFGAGTAAALRRLQAGNGLASTGVLNAATLQAIERAMGIGGGGSTGGTGRSGGSAGSGGPSATGGTSTYGGTGSGRTTGGSTSGTPRGGGSGGTFVAGTGAPSVSGGLQVGGTIDGLRIVRVIHLTATAYGPTAQDNYPYGATDAFGAPLKPGDVAVDPSVIPLNTKLFVTGYSTPLLPRGGELAVARDTGGAIKGARIDMYVNTYNESQINSFGIQHVTAYILA